MQESKPEQNLGGFGLAFGLWYTKHRILLRKIFLGSLVGLNVLLFGYSIVRGIILFTQRDDHKATLQSLTVERIDYAFWREIFRPKDPLLSAVRQLSSTDGRRDYVVTVNNPNEDFMVVRLVYQYVSGSAVLAERESFILPGQTKYLPALGVENPNPSAPVTFRIQDINWRRTDESFNEMVSDRSRLDISDIIYISSGQSPTSENLPNTKVTFTVTNNTIFNFWAAGFYVVLLNGNQVQGIHYTQTDKLESLQSRDMEVNWFDPISLVTDVQVIPEINVTDESNFYLFEFEPKDGDVK